MNDNNTDWKCKHCGHESPSHYGTCRMCGEPEKVPTSYNKWSCMGCGALNADDYETCWRCEMTMEDSEKLYQKVKQAREDPRPQLLPFDSSISSTIARIEAKHGPLPDPDGTREAHRTFDALPAAPEYAEPYNPTNAELLHKLRISRLRRHLWAAVKAFWQGVFGALIFIGWCMLVAFAVMGVLSLFIH